VVQAPGGRLVWCALRARAIAITVAALLLSAAPAMAAGDPIMPLSEVHAGMSCTGYSVIRGTDITTFDVRVDDVIDGDASGEGPRILIGVSGPAVDATGIGPGFSGSPIYCDGRNIGAISESIGEYGGDEALATPIETILGTPVDGPSEKPSAAKTATLAGARPLATPLTVTGVDPTLGKALQRAGQKVGRPILATPSGPLGTFPVQTLKPGSAVGVSYSSGDIQVGAIGTVAYTDGDMVWAFGHSFTGSGRRALFLQDAYVYRVIDNPLGLGDFGSTYKLASLGHTVGELTNDTNQAVTGRTGATPPTVPIRITANDLDTGKTLFYGIRAADESGIDLPEGASPAAFVSSLGVTQAASSLLEAPGRISGDVCFQVTLQELKKPVHFCNRYVSSLPADADFVGTANTIGALASTDVNDAVTKVDDYSGPPPHLKEVAVKMNLRRGEQRAFLRSVKLPATVRPGRRVKLRAKLRKVRGPMLTRTYRVRIPSELRPGRRKLKFFGSDVDFAEDSLFSDIVISDEDDDAGDEGPTTLKQLAASIKSVQRWDGVQVRDGLADSKRAFLDKSMRISGRASTTVRVLKKR
jgi:hypothetical protein